jgi:hypothetical protein
LFYLSFPANFSSAQDVLGIYITANTPGGGTATAAGRSYPLATVSDAVSRIFLGRQVEPANPFQVFTLISQLVLQQGQPSG